MSTCTRVYAHKKNHFDHTQEFVTNVFGGCFKAEANGKVPRKEVHYLFGDIGVVLQSCDLDSYS